MIVELVPLYSGVGYRIIIVFDKLSASTKLQMVLNVAGPHADRSTVTSFLSVAISLTMK